MADTPNPLCSCSLESSHAWASTRMRPQYSWLPVTLLRAAWRELPLTTHPTSLIWTGLGWVHLGRCCAAISAGHFVPRSVLVTSPGSRVVVVLIRAYAHVWRRAHKAYSHRCLISWRFAGNLGGIWSGYHRPLRPSSIHCQHRRPSCKWPWDKSNHASPRIWSWRQGKILGEVWEGMCVCVCMCASSCTSSKQLPDWKTYPAKTTWSKKTIEW